jgi:hypothetical protein
MTSDNPSPGAPSATTAGRRFSTAALVSAVLVGLAIGAIAAFAVTGLVFRVRVELPPPPYPPQLSSAPTAGGGCLVLPPTPTGTAPVSTPGGWVPSPPPVPHG